MKKIKSSALILAVLFLFLHKKGNTQCLVNYLQNPSFELPVQPTIGNNFPVTATNWTATGGGPVNLVKTNGTDYFGGPNNASNGVQYLDIVGGSNITVEQNIITTCNSVLKFSGDFSSREAGGSNWTAKIEIVNSANVVVATSTTRNFTAADVDVALPPGPDAIWYTMTGTSISLPAGTYKYRAIMDDYTNFDNAFLCILPGCVLPVKLNEFKVIADNCKPTLYWNTIGEINLNDFEIEESTNGTLFTKIANVVAKGLSGESSYQYPILSNTNATKFYRLKIVDKNGIFKYSDILKFVNNCENKNIEIYPNPLVNNFFINYYEPSNASGKLKIINTTGFTVKEVIVNTGVNKIDVSTFEKGVYFVIITNNNSYKTFKIIKL